MVFVACGLNHKTAPIEIREKVAFSSAAQENFLSQLLESLAVQEAVILSTCNRTEIYCHTSHEPEFIIGLLAKESGLPLEKLQPHFYCHKDFEGIKHTMRVASGLDSLMIGEPQILGQMKQAYQNACNLGTVKKDLQSIFQYIFNASKRIRTRSGIGTNSISIASAGAQLVGKYFPDYKALKVFLIGSGETISLVAKYLSKQGVTEFMVASRSQDNAQTLVSSFSGIALSIADIPQYLAQADVVISATACPLPFINKNLVQHALEQRNHKPMFFLDLAVPRDIESNVAELSDVSLYNLDHLQEMTEKGMEERREAALLAEELIMKELGNFIRWHRSLQAKEVICDYRNQMQELAQLELQRAVQKLQTGQCQYEVLSEFSERLVKKLTHTPTVGLRQAAGDNRRELLDLAQYLFSSLPSSTV